MCLLLCRGVRFTHCICTYFPCESNYLVCCKHFPHNQKNEEKKPTITIRLENGNEVCGFVFIVLSVVGVVVVVGGGGVAAEMWGH